ncbi:hypothetical protein GPECTOR_139g669 [Gonium pectorale]|uniref:mannan endo-1,4-beta-mannosidase n=1 Tax=Gonium pectorale TaxID=33097 RepID=A0A150FY15_GONPE|nr:hypothetical protein GPECTOR_139g669 [Gonium pectorale]|eukprot:KXZ42513.1 hypothetical protein GPECTOR_139g669 [Gonium pectorale]
MSGLLGALLFLGLGIASTQAATLLPPSEEWEYVKPCGHQLCLYNKPWYFMGANAYWLIDFVKRDKGIVDRFFDRCNDFGLKVIRLWAFNHRMPYAWGKYDETEFQGLDYIVDSAGRHNIRLILALGNTWSAYRSPQDYMQMAGVDPAGKDLLDFYGSAEVRHFYRDHISAIVWRTNAFNGRRYRDDAAIMMWDAMNEPRCPGCIDAKSQATQHAFLDEMTAHVKANAPHQMVALGTEGYFLNSYEGWNPGAGARCEGEDWAALMHMKSVDVSVVHAYERQMESVPPKWGKCDFACFCNYLIQYLSAHQRIAADSGKPLILEEYGLILPEYTVEQRILLFRLVADNLQWMKKTGGAMAGAMFWNAAIGTVWDDGYNVYLDGPVEKPTPKPTPAPTVTPTSAPGTSAPTSAPSSTPTSAPTSAATTPTPTSTPEPSRAPIVANTETLTDFLRGPQRAACAEEAARWWLPIWTAGWAQTVDMAAYTKRCADMTVLKVFKDTMDIIYAP